jgi:hypothetical protein
MTVEVAESNEHRHVVAFAEGLREVCTDLPAGTTLPVAMEPIHARGSCWQLTDVGPTGRGDANTARVEAGRRPVDRDRSVLPTQ